MLHEGSGELQTVTGVELVRSHQRGARATPTGSSVGLIGAEAMLRLFTEQEANERAFTALDALPRPARRDAARRPTRPALDPLALSFQLKLLWLSGYLPHLTSCVECGADDATLVGYSPRAGGAVCRACATRRRRSRSRAEGSPAIEALLSSPLADARARSGSSERATRDALARRHLVVRGPRRLPPADALAREARARRRLRARRRPRRGSTSTPCTAYLGERVVLGRAAGRASGRTS